MAQEIVGIKIVVDGQEKILTSMKEVRAELKKAQQDTLLFSETFGATSEQAVAAAKRVAQLKDSIGDAKAMTEAFNPDRKFQAFASALTGVVGGISAVQGAMGLLGVKNEEVEKTLLKVNSAMALSQGLNSILEARDSFKNLGTVIQSTALFQKANNAATVVAITLQKAFGVATVGTGRAFAILKGAIAATGIGLLVVGLSSLISKISEWTSETDKAAEAQKRLAEQTDLMNSKIENEIAILTAVGGKETEIYNLRVQQTNNELSLLRNKFKEKKGLTIEEAKQFGELKTKLITLELDEKNRVSKINEDAKKEKEKKDKEASDKALQARKENLEQRKQAAQELRDLENENFLNTIKDDYQRGLVKAAQDFEIAVQSTKDKKYKKEEENAILLELKRKFDAQVVELTNENNRKLEEVEIAQKQKNFDKIAADNQAEYDRRKYQLEEQRKWNAEELKATEELQDAKVKAVSAGLDLIGALAGKNEVIGNILFTIQKAIEIGKIVSTTTSAIAQVKAGAAAVVPFLPPYGVPNPAAAVAKALAAKQIIGLKLGAAAGIASIAASTIAKFKGGSSGGIGGTPDVGGGGGAAAPIAPPRPEATMTQLDQSINRLGSATNRAYVVESDVTNSQERIRRINRAARLN